MTIDTSALLAILLAEPEAEAFSRAMAGDPKRLLSSLSALETAIVIHARKGPAGVRELDLLLHSAAVTVVSLDADQVLLARAAYEQFGKGHHPAALNLGDCCSYALARSSGEPLLFKGSDFSQTDAVVVNLAAQREA
ncbi:MAG TPA: type II toxin-antitoxin system VapC family toxin [Thermoanaerobaculia bacterium]|nr:type II toxin-antitoxin system VapC family toxin [Thermoanaerobaculia bacterium]